MIPTIGLMVGGYIAFRCIELAARPASAYSSPRAHSIVRVAAVLGVIVTLFMCLDLLISGSGTTAKTAQGIEDGRAGLPFDPNADYSLPSSAPPK